MSIETRHPLPARLHTLAAMAGLLERLEASPTIGQRHAAAEAASGAGASAEQYRSVALCVKTLLADALASAGLDEDLHRLLRAAPHTAELYENLRYELAGLCLQPLESALNAELGAKAAITKAAITKAAGRA